MKVNDIDAEPGLIVSGDEHGQYSAERLADIAIAYGIALDADNDPREWRARARAAEERGEDGVFEAEHMAAAEEALLDTVNAATDGGWFEWRDGSVWLVEDTDEYEEEEDDDEYDYEET